MVDDAFSRLIDDEEAADRGDLLPPDAPADRVFVRRFLRAAGRVRVEAVPASVRAAIDERFETWRAGRVPASLGDLVRAVLSQDVLPGTVVAGARGATAARHLVFSSELADISVHVSDRRGVGALDGMVLRADGLDATHPVTLLRDGSAVVETATDLVGSFRIEDLPDGRYSLLVLIDATEVETAAFDLTAGAG